MVVSSCTEKDGECRFIRNRTIYVMQQDYRYLLSASSTRMSSTPFCARWAAQERPETPAPTTITRLEDISRRKFGFLFANTRLSPQLTPIGGDTLGQQLHVCTILLSSSCGQLSTPEKYKRGGDGNTWTDSADRYYCSANRALVSACYYGNSSHQKQDFPSCIV